MGCLLEFVIFPAILGVVFYLIAGCMSLIGGNNNDATVKKQTVQKQQLQKKAHEENLTLSGLTLGSTVENMHAVLGKEKSLKQSSKHDGMMMYSYDMITVGVENGIVTSIVSESNAANTPRNIHPGSDFKTVITTYGDDYKNTTYDGKDLYEYTILADNGKKAILRFAIKNHKVDYISIRYAD